MNADCHAQTGSKLISLTLQSKIVSNHTAFSTQKSLRYVMRILVLEGKFKLAQKLRTDFNMSERHSHWVKAAALANKHDWNNLEMFANDKRSPIGYLPFVELCQQHGAPKAVISKYIAKLYDARQRAELYTQAGLKHEAQDAAATTSNVTKSFAVKAVGFFMKD